MLFSLFLIVTAGLHQWIDMVCDGSSSYQNSCISSVPKSGNPVNWIVVYTSAELNLLKLLIGAGAQKGDSNETAILLVMEFGIACTL